MVQNELIRARPQAILIVGESACGVTVIPSKGMEEPVVTSIGILIAPLVRHVIQVFVNVGAVDLYDGRDSIGLLLENLGIIWKLSVSVLAFFLYGFLDWTTYSSYRREAARSRRTRRRRVADPPERRKHLWSKG